MKKKSKQKGYKLSEKDCTSQRIDKMHKNKQTFWSKATGGRMK